MPRFTPSQCDVFLSAFVRGDDAMTSWSKSRDFWVTLSDVSGASLMLLEVNFKITLIKNHDNR